MTWPRTGVAESIAECGIRLLPRSAASTGHYSDVAVPSVWLDGDGTPTFVDTIATARDAVDLLATHPPIGTPIASGWQASPVKSGGSWRETPRR